MLRIRPFQAIRPEPGSASRVASLPYDVVNTAEARAIAGDNEDSFLHVVRSEIDLPDGSNPYDDAVYDQAQRNLDGLLERGSMVRDDKAGIFLYRQVMDENAQIGIVCCCHIEDYLNDIIKKHEKTRPDKEDDRTRHVLSINANSGPVFLTYRDDASIESLVDAETAVRPLYHFVAEDGVTHTVWRVSNPDRFVEAFSNVPCAYVADGHHRSASAARAGAERRAANPNHTGDEEYNWFLSVLFPASQLNILAYNRVVKDTNGLSTPAIIGALSAVGDVEPASDPVPERPGVFCIYLGKDGGGWHRLTIPDSAIDQDDPINSLDVALLQDRVLHPVFGVGDPRTDPRIDFVGGIRGTEELERLVDEGRAGVAISMYPTTIEQLLAVSDAGLIMPPKSTWFEPKLRSGLFVHSLD